MRRRRRRFLIESMAGLCVRGWPMHGVFTWWCKNARFKLVPRVLSPTRPWERTLGTRLYEVWVKMRGLLPYITHYRYVLPLGLWSLCRLGLKTDVHFAHFGYGFRGNDGSVWMYLLFQFQTNKKERVIYQFEVDSENGSGKWHFKVWNRVRIWRTARHTPTKNSQEYSLPQVKMQGSYKETHSKRKTTGLPLIRKVKIPWLSTDL